MREKYVTCDFCGRRFNVYDEDFWTVHLKHENKLNRPGIMGENPVYSCYGDSESYDCCTICIKDKFQRYISELLRCEEAD